MNFISITNVALDALRSQSVEFAELSDGNLRFLKTPSAKFARHIKRVERQFQNVSSMGQSRLATEFCTAVNASLTSEPLRPSSIRALRPIHEVAADAIKEDQAAFIGACLRVFYNRFETAEDVVSEFNLTEDSEE